MLERVSVIGSFPEQVATCLKQMREEETPYDDTTRPGLDLGAGVIQLGKHIDGLDGRPVNLDTLAHLVVLAAVCQRFAEDFVFPRLRLPQRPRLYDPPAVATGLVDPPAPPVQLAKDESRGYNA